MLVFISTGEPSGDLHAANLVRALRKRWPEARFVGYGGPELRRAGATILFELTNLAVMWFFQVFRQIATFLGLIRRADRYFRDERPDVVVLIDYPGLHWWIARKAKARGIPVIYYVPPQLWAWAGWRVKKVRRFVDLVLCSLPFEPAWYAARGVPGAVFVGHPYFDELTGRTVDEAFLDEQRVRGGPLVAILPGSRTRELVCNGPILARAAARVARERPGTRFAVACLRPAHAELFREIVAKEGVQLPSLEIHIGRTPELIRAADVAWAVSGSVGLELLHEALPTVVLYKVGRLDLVIARPFIKARYISLVNLLADAEVMPEYLTDRDVSPELADHALRWLDDSSERLRTSRALADLRDRVAAPGASDRAAERIVQAIEGSSLTYRGPHPVHSRPGAERSR
jgi:lipid-A-disaccharide synthase